MWRALAATATATATAACCLPLLPHTISTSLA